MTTSNLATTCYLVLGCGESTIPAVRSADNDPENWTLAAVLFHRQWSEWQSGIGTNEPRWCVLVDDVAESDLDSDAAVVCYREIWDFDLALGACAGFEPRDPALRAGAIRAMRDAGAIK